jgi:DNA-binding transcriptional MerR regulator
MLSMDEKTWSTREVASKVGVSSQTLHTWIETGKIAAPRSVTVGKSFIRLWTKADIDRARKFKGTLKRGPKPKK